MMNNQYTYEIEQDCDICESPREWDNLAIFAFPNVHFGDTQDSLIDVARDHVPEYVAREIFVKLIAGLELSQIKQMLIDSNYDYFECINEMGYLDECFAICERVYMYDHSGQTISTSPFNCPWDSGQIGWAIVTHEAIEKENMTLEQAQKRLEGEVNTMAQWLEGDVWGYRIFENGEDIDSCWGFYGRNYCEQEAQGLIKYYEQEAHKKRIEQVKTWIKNRVPLQIRESQNHV